MKTPAQYQPESQSRCELFYNIKHHKQTMIHGYLVIAPSSDPFTSKNRPDLKRFQGGPQEWSKLGKGFHWEMIKWGKTPVNPLDAAEICEWHGGGGFGSVCHLLLFVFQTCYKIHCLSTIDISIVFLFLQRTEIFWGLAQNEERISVYYRAW